MEDFITSLLDGQGIWASASILLTLYVLKTTEKREERSIKREDEHLSIINSFKENFGQVNQRMNTIEIGIENIQEELKEVKKNG